MKISDVISKLEKYKKELGDVNLLFLNGDGQSSWVSDFNPTIKKQKIWPMKESGYTITHDGY